MGKRIFLFGILTFLIVSCTNNNDETVLPKRVTSVKYIALIYDDITLSNYYNPSSGKISFEYDNLNRINKVNGGLVLAGSLTNFYELTLGDEAQDNISYENNVIKVECSYNTDYRPYNKEFVVQNDKIISSKSTKWYKFLKIRQFKFMYKKGYWEYQQNGEIFITI